MANYCQKSKATKQAKNKQTKKHNRERGMYGEGLNDAANMQSLHNESEWVTEQIRNTPDVIVMVEVAAAEVKLAGG